LKVLGRIHRWNTAIAGSILFLMAIVISVDILKRWLTGRPFVGIFEFTEVGFLVLSFLAFGLVEHSGRQMRVDLVSDRIQGRPGHLLRAITGILGLGFWGIILWKGSGDWLRAYQIHDVRQGMIQLPSITYLGVLVYGTFLVCVTLIHSAWGNFRLTFRRRRPAGQTPSPERKSGD